jgi:hypothetical protein
VSDGAHCGSRHTAPCMNGDRPKSSVMKRIAPEMRIP